MKLTKTLNLNASLIGASVVILAIPLFITSCITEVPRFSEDLVLPDVPYSYQNADANMATLGRVLFYDKNLSANNTVSCSSCHKQELGFADDRKLSLGFNNSPTRRNSMGIQNLSMFEPLQLFWDGRETQLSAMVTRPIFDPVEMGITQAHELNTKLENIGNYKILFSNAFGNNEVTKERIGEALAAFVQSIQAMNFIDTSFNNLNGQEKLGAELFVSKYECNSCHQIQSAHGYVEAGTFANIGLENVYADNGLGEITFQEMDNGKFKIPSLRNVVLTAPYMHDGRFQTLEEAIDHYSTGIKSHPNLDVKLRNDDGSPKVFSITPAERDAIIAFLSTLTSHEILSDIRFSDPFVH